MRYLRCSPSVGGGDSDSTPAESENCSTPIRSRSLSESCSTPTKRRRLTIKGSLRQLDQAFFATKRKDIAAADVHLPGTPSRADGISETSERVARLLVCESSRCVIRDFFNGRKLEASHEEMRLQAQALACHAVQAFFMSASVRQEDAGAVAIASALLALEAIDFPCEPEDAVEAYNVRRVAIGLPEFGAADGPLENLRSPAEVIRETQMRLSRFIRTHEPLMKLPFSCVDSLVDHLVERLPASKVFQNRCGHQDPVAQALLLQGQLARTTRCFLADSLLGPDPLLAAEPRAAVAAALVLAAQYLLFRVGGVINTSEWFELLSGSGAIDGLVQSQLQRAIDEILSVFRLWKEVSEDMVSWSRSALSVTIKTGILPDPLATPCIVAH